MRRNKYFVVLILTVVLTGCTRMNKTDKFSFQEEIERLENELKDREEKISSLVAKLRDLEIEDNNIRSENLLTYSMEVMETIRDKDMDALSKCVHPNLGIRFTPYFYIDMQDDMVFTAQQIEVLMQDNQLYNWGNYDGSGEPIELTFSDYYDSFIYSNEFINPQIIGNNVAIGKGNETDNITIAYPNAQFVEFHFSIIDPQYGGADWSSLRLVFEELNNTWYLVGIVHGQWTI